MPPADRIRMAAPPVVHVERGRLDLEQVQVAAPHVAAGHHSLCVQVFGHATRREALDGIQHRMASGARQPVFFFV